MTSKADLIIALRARPNEKAMKALRNHAEAMSATAHGLSERLAANALHLLIEQHDRVTALLGNYEDSK